MLAVPATPPSGHGSAPRRLGRQRARNPGPPRADAHLDHCFKARIPISGDLVGGHDPHSCASPTGSTSRPSLSSTHPAPPTDDAAERAGVGSDIGRGVPPPASRSPACHRRGRLGGSLAWSTNLWIPSDVPLAVIAPEAATAILRRGPHERPRSPPGCGGAPGTIRERLVRQPERGLRRRTGAAVERDDPSTIERNQSRGSCGARPSMSGAPRPCARSSR